MIRQKQRDTEPETQEIDTQKWVLETEIEKGYKSDMRATEKATKIGVQTIK